MQHVNRWLTNEAGIFVTHRPRSSLVTDKTHWKSELAVSRGLHVFGPFVRQQRENFLIILNRFVARRFGHLSPRKELLWHDYMRDMRPVGSRKKQLSIPREIKPARIAFESRDHFKRAAVRLKSKNPAANVREAFAFLIL